MAETAVVANGARRQGRHLRSASQISESASVSAREADLKLIRELQAARASGDDGTAQLQYRTLVERYNRRAFAVAYNLLQSEHDAEDVVQESFVKAFLSLNDFHGESAFYTWFYRIVFNMALDLKRKAERRRSVPASGEMRSQGSEGETGNGTSLLDRVTAEEAINSGSIESPDGALERNEQRAVIQHELNQLSEEHRTMVLLRDVEGMSYEDIAQIVGVSKGTVMSRLFYARKRLQEGLRGLRNLDLRNLDLRNLDLRNVSGGSSIE